MYYSCKKQNSGVSGLSTAWFKYNESDNSWIALPLNEVGQGYNNCEVFENGWIRYLNSVVFSFDDGISWNELNLPFSGGNPQIDMELNAIIWSWSNARYISYDFGQTFIDLNQFPFTHPISLIHATESKTYVRVGNFQTSSIIEGFYVSNNNGDFTKLEQGINFWDIKNNQTNIVIANDYIYSRVPFVGFRKFNTDLTSIPMNNDFENYVPINISSLDIDNDGNLYALSNLKGLHIKKISENSWNRDANLFYQWPLPNYNFRFSTSKENTIFIGGCDPGRIHKSIDNGENFNYGNQFYWASVIGVYADKNNSNRVIE